MLKRDTRRSGGCRVGGSDHLGWLTTSNGSDSRATDFAFQWGFLRQYCKVCLGRRRRENNSCESYTPPTGTWPTVSAVSTAPTICAGRRARGRLLRLGKGRCPARRRRSVQRVGRAGRACASRFAIYKRRSNRSCATAARSLTLTGNHDKENFCQTLRHAMNLAAPGVKAGSVAPAGRLYLATGPTLLQLMDRKA